MIKIDENLYEVNECVTIPFASQYWIGKMNNESCPMFYTLADNCCLTENFHHYYPAYFISVYYYLAYYEIYYFHHAQYEVYYYYLLWKFFCRK